MEKSLSKFVALWLGQSISVFGTELSAFAATSWVVQVGAARHGDRQVVGVMLTLLMLGVAVPRIAVAPVAGAWADRMDRRRLMIGLNLAAAATTALLSALALTGRLEVMSLIALVTAGSVIQTFYTAAFQASYVMIVPADQLGRASGLMKIAMSSCRVLAPLLGALLVGLPALVRGRTGAVAGLLGDLSGGWGLAFALDASSFALAAIVLVFIAIPSPRTSSPGAPATGASRQGMWRDIAAGLGFLRARPALLWLLGLTMASTLLTAPEAVLIPLLLKWNLGADLAAHGLRFEQAYAAVTAAANAGGIVGGVIVATWGGLKRRRINGVLVALGVLGLCQAGYGLAPVLGFACVMAFVREHMVPVLYVHEHTLWQTVVPAELQGRVFAVRNGLQAGCAVLAIALAGVLAGWANPGWLFAGAGAVLGGMILLQAGSAHRLALEPPGAAPCLATGAGR